MIETFLYSIQGKKTNDVIDVLVEEFLSSLFTPQAHKRVLQKVKDVSKNGNYPTKEYFDNFYKEPPVVYKSLAEIKTHCKDTMDLFKRQYLQKKLMEAINESESTKALIESVQNVIDLPQDSTVVEGLGPRLYTKLKEGLSKGIPTGVRELDEVTNGFQPATVASICGFVAEGKSTFTNSIIFKNALEGRKCVLVSLEMAPDILWQQFEARYLNQVKGIQVSAQDLLFNKVPADELEKIQEAEKDFVNEFACNLEILDEGYLSKSMMLNFKSFDVLIKSIEEKLGGLDLIAFDHVGQFELMFKDCGNQIIKTIQAFSKTHVDQRGIRPAVIMAVQANRQGNLRARKRNGVYDLQAISDLNEVERSSTYVVFLYTSDDMKIMQETKITMLKHRLGSVITEPIVTTFNPAIITVGQSLESVEMSDDDFNDLDLDLGDGFDDF